MRRWDSASSIGWMPNDSEYADAIEHELGVLADGSSDADRQRITELKRLLPIFRRGPATKADRAAARRVLHASSFNVLKLRRGNR